MPGEPDWWRHDKGPIDDLLLPVIHEQFKTFLKNISKDVGFLGKAMNIYFVASLTSF